MSDCRGTAGVELVLPPLQSVDISDASNPSPISTATLSTFVSGAVIQGDYAYVPGSISGVMMIVDVSDPANMVELSSIPTGGYALSLDVVDTLAYVPTAGTSMAIVDRFAKRPDRVASSFRG